MENELQDKTKVDRGLLNAWFIEVQRTKVRKTRFSMMKLSLHIFFFEEEAEKYRKRRDTTMDCDKQVQLAVQEIEQVIISSSSSFFFSF